MTQENPPTTCLVHSKHHPFKERWGLFPVTFKHQYWRYIFLPQVEHVKNERSILKVRCDFWQIQKNGSPEISVQWALKFVLPGTLCDTLKRWIVDLKRLKPKVRRNQPGGVVVGEKIPVNSLHHEILENPSLHLLPTVTKPIKRKVDKYSGEIPGAQK